MSNIKRKWDFLSKEKRKLCVDDIVSFMKENNDEEIGIIGAGEILDCILQNAASDIYNQGIEDSKSLLKNSFYDLEVDLDLLLHQ
jgi:uncharacterized protein (DUF2164 family)